MFKEQFLSREHVITREKGRVEWKGEAEGGGGGRNEQTSGSGVRISV